MLKTEFGINYSNKLLNGDTLFLNSTDRDSSLFDIEKLTPTDSAHIKILHFKKAKGQPTIILDYLSNGDLSFSVPDTLFQSSDKDSIQIKFTKNEMDRLNQVITLKIFTSTLPIEKKINLDLRKTLR